MKKFRKYTIFEKEQTLRSIKSANIDCLSIFDNPSAFPVVYPQVFNIDSEFKSVHSLVYPPEKEKL